ncbi:hypothetical protein ACFOY8_13460 [Thalassospira xianhensis]|uniref:DUF1566 domain-containing protein n=1 Tax=Thalassospira xianhensis MCCC 1A02616 TaxID=1177929 RepID=A0A367UHM5_9PROT|nr:hypothetical protein [Thalassospira xianhensis]RCK07806.1 hypothetical protein TH5_01825 [Thalassospira xianhensis MCCC 1A02616]
MKNILTAAFIFLAAQAFYLHTSALASPDGSGFIFRHNLRTMELVSTTDVSEEPPVAPEPCNGAPEAASPGTICADGSVYIGTSPDGNVPMYAVFTDMGMGYWGTSAFATLATSPITGEANSLILYNHITAGDGTANPDDGVSPNIFVTCYNLVAHGHDDWYVPARDEVPNNLLLPDGVDFWTSTGSGTANPDTAYFRNFSSWVTFYKDTTHSFTCVRKD